jgi:hypothetical protein
MSSNEEIVDMVRYNTILYEELKETISTLCKDVKWLIDGQNDEIEKLRQSILVNKQHDESILKDLGTVQHDFRYNAQKLYRIVDVLHVVTEKVFDKETADSKCGSIHIITE